jgi:hypothetical protein
MAIQLQDTSVRQRNGSIGQRQHDKTLCKTHACLVRFHALLGLDFNPWSFGGTPTAVRNALTAPFFPWRLPPSQNYGIHRQEVSRGSDAAPISSPVVFEFMTRAAKRLKMCR